MYSLGLSNPPRSRLAAPSSHDPSRSASAATLGAAQREDVGASPLDWEEEAWDDGSDDESFVEREGVSSASSRPPAPGSSNRATTTTTAAASASAAVAVGSSSSRKPNGRSSESVKSPPSSPPLKPRSRVPTATWTLVGADGKVEGEGLSSSLATSSDSTAGSTLRDHKHAYEEDGDSDDTEAGVAAIGFAKGKRRMSEIMSAVVHSHVDDLVKDPTTALHFLRLSSPSTTSPPSPATPSIPKPHRTSGGLPTMSVSIPAPSSTSAPPSASSPPITTSGRGIPIPISSYSSSSSRDASDAHGHQPLPGSLSSSYDFVGPASAFHRPGLSSPTSTGRKEQSISPPRYEPLQTEATPSNGRWGTRARSDSVRTVRRRERFIKCLEAEEVDMAELRKLAWSGIPDELRPMAWQLLLGHLPTSRSIRRETLARKRAEYAEASRYAFSKELNQTMWHQISIDVPRTKPGTQLWQYDGTQRSLERILYVWAVRHPASGYVQGINDLATPFFTVFLGAYIGLDAELYDVSRLPLGALEALEADTFWCLSKLLDGIQDNYTHAQPGIQRQVKKMAELVARIDAPLHAHLQAQNVEFMHFAFRWMNCLLMREMSVRNIIRIWDTYLAEGADAFSQFHVYVCSAFLVKWSDKLQGMDFQGIIMFLQSLPTQDWTDKDAELLLSEAFMWKSLFHDAHHLTKSSAIPLQQ